MKSYLTYFRLRIITDLQYRTAALAGIVTQLFFAFVYILFYLAFYESNDIDISYMDWNSLVTYLWLQQTFYAATYPFLRDSELLNKIQNGNLAYDLIRPQNFYLKYYIKMFSNRVSSTILRCLPIIIIGSILPYPYHLSAPSSSSSLIIFIISIIFACFLATSFSLIIHLITMYTIDSRGIISLYTMIAEVFMGIVIPLPFLPKFMMKIANILPFKYLADYPYRIYSGDIIIGDGLISLLSSFIWIIVSTIIGYLLTKNALKKAVIQGG